MGIIRQYVALTGLGIEEFNSTLTGLARVHKYFKDVLPADKLERLDPFSLHGYLALACHTRYFHARHLCQSAVAIPFGPGVDPLGVLERIAGDLYVHTEDNVVQYLGKKTDRESCYDLIPGPPHFPLFT